MKIIGVEFAGSEMRYVIVECENEKIQITGSNRVRLSDTREPSALRAFHSAVQTLLNEQRPQLIAIKNKPEVGRLRAGAAALKMEGILLALAACEFDFVSGARVNRSERIPNDLHEYHQIALRTVAAALKRRQ